MRYILILLSILATSGCTNDWYIGEWTVTDAKFPGISAIGVDEASEWFGSKAIYAESSVSFQGETCSQPQFTVKDVTEAEFRELYRASFLALDIDHSSVEMLEVGCPTSWTYPGATMIKVNANTAYIPWDGTFFKLVKHHP
jgi:hypothetical protein